MKTKMLSLFITVCAVTQIMAHTNNEPEKEKTKKEDSSEVIEMKFEMKLDNESDILTVELAGNFDKYASVSVTNNRGSEYFFSFVENNSNQVTFDLSTLKKGSYFLVLNTNNEIRIKRFLIN